MKWSQLLHQRKQGHLGKGKINSTSCLTPTLIRTLELWVVDNHRQIFRQKKQYLKGYNQKFQNNRSLILNQMQQSKSQTNCHQRDFLLNKSEIWSFMKSQTAIQTLPRNKDNEVTPLRRFTKMVEGTRDTFWTENGMDKALFTTRMADTTKAHGRIIWWMDMGNCFMTLGKSLMRDIGTRTNFMAEARCTTILLNCWKILSITQTSRIYSFTGSITKVIFFII